MHVIFTKVRIFEKLWLCSELYMNLSLLTFRKYPSASNVFPGGAYGLSAGKRRCERERYESGHALLHRWPLCLQPWHAALSPALLKPCRALEQSLQTASQRARRGVSPSAVHYCTRRASLMLSGASTLVLLLLSNNTGRSPELAGIQPPRGLGGAFPL